MLTRVLKVFCILGVLFSFIGIQAFANSDELPEKILVVGTSADYPPFEFIKDGEVVGYDIELAHIIAKKLGYKLQIQDMKFSSVISSIQIGRIDFGISGITRTPERERNVDFSIKYYIPKLAMVYRKENPILSVKDLSQKTIAAQAGTTMEIFLQKKLKMHENFELISLNKTPVLIEELKMKRVDGVLIEESQAKVFKKRYPKMLNFSLFKSVEDGYAIVFKKGSPLKEKFDKAIKDLKKSGELNRLKKKWFTK